MAITTLLKINDNIIPKIKTYDVEFPKLWAQADRNLKGDLVATYIGTFPKINLEFTYMNRVEMAQILSLLVLPYITVQYWDILRNGLRTATFYAGEFKSPLYDKTRELFKPFTVNLIATKRYT